MTIIRYSVLVNGEASELFSTSRGLCRGDPLSPLLILVMETLSGLVNKAIDVDFLEGCQNH